MTFFEKVRNYIFGRMGIEIIGLHPRESVKFAKEYFNNYKVDIAEIGVLYGDNSRNMNKMLNVNKFYLIDSYKSYDDYMNDGAVSRLKRAKKYAHRINRKGNEIWLEEMSEDAVKHIPMLDFIYIDGNHSYQYVKKDIELYWNKLKDGGILAGHDIQWKDVQTAVLEFVIKHNLLENLYFGDRRDWWIKK